MADCIDVLLDELHGWLPTVLVRMILQYIMKDDGKHFTPLRASLAREQDWWVISADKCEGVFCKGESRHNCVDLWEYDRVCCQPAPPRVLLNTDYFYFDGESVDQWQFRSMSEGVYVRSTAIGMIPAEHFIIVRYHATRDNLKNALAGLAHGGFRIVIHDASGTDVTHEFFVSGDGFVYDGDD